MKTLMKNSLITLASLALLTSCLEKPKEKTESVLSGESYEKVLDSVLGEGTITPSAIRVGQKDTRIETLNVSNSLIRELYRRELTVASVECEPALSDGSCPPNPSQRKITYNVKVIERDNQGNAQETTTTRKTVVAINSEGYYQFFDDGTEKTIHSWDYVIGLRGFCHSFETEKYKVDVACANFSVKDQTWGHTNIPAMPVKVLSMIRGVTVLEKDTGKTQTSKLRYTVAIAPGVQEISKVVSYCSEGMQQFENQIYYLVRCNNLEAL